MAKIRHIAIAVEDVKATAEFYKKAFDLEEVNVFPNSILLSDGTVSLAILDVNRNKNAPNAQVGLHHIGFQIKDIDEASKRVEACGGKFLGSIVDSRAASGGKTERKYYDPNGIRLDVSNEDHARNVWRIPV